MRKLLILASVLALLAGMFAPSVFAATGGNGKANGKPASVETAVDAAKSKLHPKLQKKLAEGATGTVQVFATVRGSAAEARSYLKNSYATNGDVKLVIGTIRVQALPKLASSKGVIAVSPIEFAQTGRPLGSKEPLSRPSHAQLDTVLKNLYKQEVPYSKAPPPAGSNFAELKELAVLDAKTHNFAEAWEAGYTGAGVTVGVLDGGTDFGHPDLLGTWQVWSGQTGPRAGWNGWPKAFDPFGVLQFLASTQVEQGLSWYTETDAAVCKDWASKGPKATCSVKFNVRLGPSRNFAAPDAKRQHTYQFPASYSKSGNVRLGSHPDDYLLSLFGERVAFLVTDSTTAGVYDTIYVDLDHDFKFDDEKPVTKASPAAYRDMNGDGYTDLSGGLVYYISDGVTAVPGGIDPFIGPSTLGYGPGELVAWTGDFDPAIGGHGTLTASNIVGQGVINGNAPVFQDLPGDGKYPGAVIGGAPDAKLAPFGDIYFSFDFSTQLGYYLSTRMGIDVTSNSYGSSDVDNDGWDAASQEADVIHSGRRTTPLFSTGNGAPGFGTTAPPSPSAAIAVGASTQFGGTGWDSIYDTTQITDNEVMVWSNRGFGATGSPGVDIVADGAFSAGSLTLNSFLNGNVAWETWGGTSRSTPVAAGAAALVYQAWREANGTPPPNFFRQVKQYLKSGATDLGYPGTIQGAGAVDAYEAVLSAIGAQASVTPTEWRAGDYRGDEYDVFAHVMSPGDTDSQEFSIDGPGTWDISDREMVRTDVETFTFSSENIAQESPANFNAPDYLIDITDLVDEHPDADLMVVRANFPRSQFDANGDYSADQAWRLLTYDWTDQDGDGKLWNDTNGNGVVNYTQFPFSNNPDNFLEINYAASEIDQGEYVRFMYHRAGANHLMSFLRDPAHRYSDGIFLGLQHSTKSASHPVTDFEIEVAFYENSDWSWIETPPSASGSFTADIEVPEGTPYGMYEGAIVLTNGDDEMVVPVAVAVAATVEQDTETGAISGSLTFGGADVAEAQADYLYNNGAVFGANDWTWRAESGDWRFFFLDVPVEPAAGTLFLANTTWDGTAPYTDIDTLLMGRTQNHFQLLADAVFGGPYMIGTLGGSPNANTGAGVWRFNTATGGAEDFVAAPASEGLNAVVLHQVGWQGDDFTTPFEVTLGSAAVAPSAVDIDSDADSGSFDITFTSSVDLAGLSAEAFGLSQPVELVRQAAQDDPNDPSSATVKEDIAIEHASSATFTVDVGSDDIDLFIVFDENEDGVFTNSEIVGSSTGGAGSDELVRLVRPADGNYQLWAQGWQVAGTPNITIGIDVVQGLDMTLSGVPGGAVDAGDPVVIHVDFSKSMTVGETYFGEILLGPPTAPTALRVPVQVTRIAAP
ncbi:MAG TPA: S8 family serine peptidase [Candidatus Binatia bacterium]|nr:S8 family serine peptidase [Candidatus Binatia bacterium]